jgi:CheY-like chemotaxis protein
MMKKEGAGRKILVVDDMPESIRLVKKVLEVRGYKVIEAQTGADAINTTQTEFPDLILMDVRLPGGIDGLEATKRIKALSQLAHIPILAMTASVRLEDMHWALDAGCVGFIRKPIDINELPKQVAQYIARAEV